MKTRLECLVLTGSIALALVGMTGSARAQSVIPGVRLGLYTDAEAVFVGGELLARVQPSLFLNPNIEYVFDEDRTHITFNMDLHYDLASRSGTFVWVGGGLAGIYTNPEGPPDGEAEIGVNLLAGVGLPSRTLTPYVQGKAILSDDSDFSLAFGVRF